MITVMTRCSYCGIEFESNSNQPVCLSCGHRLSNSSITHSAIYSESNSDIPLQISLNEFDRLRLENGDLVVKGKIGLGGFGTVYKIESNQKVYALKILDLWKKRPNEWDQLKRRFNQSCIAADITSSNLVKTYSNGFISGNPYLLMEYCPNGNLASRMKEFLPFNKFNNMGKAVLEGLAELHRNGIVHRDIKPENILFDQNDIAKLTDFDISVFIDKRETVRNWLGKVKEVWGTAVYAPPEQLDHKKAYTLTRPSLDMFAFGITMYETLTNGLFPFGSYEDYQRDPIAYYEKIKKGEFIPIEQAAKGITVSWCTVINACLNPDPEKRLGNAMLALEILETKKYSNEDTEPRLNNANYENALFQILNGEQPQKLYDLELVLQGKNNRILKLGWENSKNDIGIKESFTKLISSAHATLEKHHNQWYLRDGQLMDGEWKYSLNGTMINATNIQKNDAVLLKPNDVITIGDTTLKFIVK